MRKFCTNSTSLGKTELRILVERLDSDLFLKKIPGPDPTVKKNLDPGPT